MDVLSGGIRKSSKGLGVIEIFKQAICFFIDGASRHLVHFDNITVVMNFRILSPVITASKPFKK